MGPYFRAYLAGIALPTMVLPAVIAMLSLQPPIAHGFRLEEVAIFPIGLAPNAWGLWNMLYLRLRKAREIPIGLFGAALAIAILPAGYGVQLALGKFIWTPQLVAIGVPIALALYYLAWKHIVGRLNDQLGIG